jgi:hypothetical protein
MNPKFNDKVNREQSQLAQGHHEPVSGKYNFEAFLWSNIF